MIHIQCGQHGHFARECPVIGNKGGKWGKGHKPTNKSGGKTHGEKEIKTREKKEMEKEKGGKITKRGVSGKTLMNKLIVT